MDVALAIDEVTLLYSTTRGYAATMDGGRSFRNCTGSCGTVPLSTAAASLRIHTISGLMPAAMGPVAGYRPTSYVPGSAPLVAFHDYGAVQLLYLLSSLSSPLSHLLSRLSPPGAGPLPGDVARTRSTGNFTGFSTNVTQAGASPPPLRSRSTRPSPSPVIHPFAAAAAVSADAGQRVHHAPSQQHHLCGPAARHWLPQVQLPFSIAGRREAARKEHGRARGDPAPF